MCVRWLGVRGMGEGSPSTYTEISLNSPRCRTAPPLFYLPDSAQSSVGKSRMSSARRCPLARCQIAETFHRKLLNKLQMKLAGRYIISMIWNLFVIDGLWNGRQKHERKWVFLAGRNRFCAEQWILHEADTLRRSNNEEYIWDSLTRFYDEEKSETD